MAEEHYALLSCPVSVVAQTGQTKHRLKTTTAGGENVKHLDVQLQAHRQMPSFSINLVLY